MTEQELMEVIASLKHDEEDEPGTFTTSEVVKNCEISREVACRLCDDLVAAGRIVSARNIKRRDRFGTWRSQPGYRIVATGKKSPTKAKKSR